MLAVTMVQASSSSANKLAKPIEFTTIQWPDLMPQEDLDALLNPLEHLANIDISLEDQISSQISACIATAKDDRYQQALVSTKIKPK